MIPSRIQPMQHLVGPARHSVLSAVERPPDERSVHFSTLIVVKSAGKGSPERQDGSSAFGELLSQKVHLFDRHDLSNDLKVQYQSKQDQQAPREAKEMRRPGIEPGASRYCMKLSTHLQLATANFTTKPPTLSSEVYLLP